MATQRATLIASSATQRATAAVAEGKWVRFQRNVNVNTPPHVDPSDRVQHIKAKWLASSEFQDDFNYSVDAAQTYCIPQLDKFVCSTRIILC